MVDTVRTGRTGNAALVGVLLAASTVGTWLLVLPTRWTLRETEPNTYSTAVPTSGIVIVAVVLVALSVAAGALGHRWLPLPAVALPAVLLWCYQAANAESIGANLWVIGALLLTPVAFGGAAIAGWLGSRLRRS